MNKGKNSGFNPKYYYKVEATIKNGLLVQLMELHNVSARQLAQACGVSYSRLNDMINLKRSPCRSNPSIDGKIFTTSAEKIAKYFHMSPTEIFPEELWRPFEDNVISMYVPKKPESFLNRDEKKILRDVLGTLTDRERIVVEMRFGLNGNPAMTRVEIAREFNITRERVMQIEVKAFCKLHHPYRKNRLRMIFDAAKDACSVRGRTSVTPTSHH